MSAGKEEADDGDCASIWTEVGSSGKGSAGSDTEVDAAEEGGIVREEDEGEGKEEAGREGNVGDEEERGIEVERGEGEGEGEGWCEDLGEEKEFLERIIFLE